MDEMRKPFFIVALILLTLVVALEVGASVVIEPGAVSATELQRALADSDEDLDDDEIDDALEELATAAAAGDPPGLAIPALAIIDGMLLVSMLGLAAGLVVPHRSQGRVVAPSTLVVSVLLIIVGIVLILVTLTLLLIMVGLFLSSPFGTLAYLARWGSFPRGQAQVVLGLLWMLKLGFIGFALAASPRLVTQKGLVALVVTSVVLQLMVGFLHAVVPLPLVSITDAVAAIVVSVVGVIWALIIAAGSIVGTVRVLRVTRE
jgi:hypothetical protein